MLSALLPLLNLWLFFALLPWRFFYYVYIRLPCFIFHLVFETIAVQLALLYEVSQRRSPLFRQFTRQLKSLVYTVCRIFFQVIHTKPSQLFRWIFITIIEAILTYIYYFFDFQDSKILTKQLSFEVISYEEDDVYDASTPELVTIMSKQRQKMDKVMHNYIPLNTFRATVRSKKSKRTRSVFPFSSDETDEEALCSPASFPSTPYSLAKVMSRSAGRVDDVMYSARDKIRMQQSCASSDKVAKTIACEAKLNGKSSTAAFDPTLVTNGLYLSSGNHCAQKLGQLLCNSCRSTVAVLPETYIYFEFSIMTSSDNGAPILAIGLAPPDCPLNVMVGSWPQSVGLNSDGNVIINSRWSNNLSSTRMNPGDTIGALVRLPANISSKSSSVSTNTNSDESDDEEYPMARPFNPLFAIRHFLGFTRPLQQLSKVDATVGVDTGATRSVEITPLLVFNLNGNVLRFPETAEENLTSELKMNPPLYPTVSLLSENTKVWCRFDKGDIVFQSRRNIGAPAGVKVYCLDGTLLLDEADD